MKLGDLYTTISDEELRRKLNCVSEGMPLELVLWPKGYKYKFIEGHKDVYHLPSKFYNRLSLGN